MIETFMIPFYQKELIKKLCYCKCGKLIGNGLDPDEVPAVKCTEKKCNYVFKDIRLGQLGGQIIYERILTKGA